MVIPMIDPEYLSLADLMTYASVKSKTTLQKWLGRGMPFYRVGRCLRVKKAEFDSWMQQFRNGTSDNLDTIWNQVMEV